MINSNTNQMPGLLPQEIINSITIDDIMLYGIPPGLSTVTITNLCLSCIFLFDD